MFKNIAIISIILLSSVSPPGIARADILFTIDTGSTITPSGGVAEPLQGSFVWRNAGQGGSGIDGVLAEIYDTVFLDLSSPSFQISLNTTANDRASVAFSNNTSAFGEIVDITGSSTTVFDMITISTVGTLEGTYLSPSRLVFTELWLLPVNGGGPQYRLQLSATAVPEPTTSVLVATGLFGLFASRRKFFCKSKLKSDSMEDEQSVAPM
jgi:hypothetical protein